MFASFHRVTVGVIFAAVFISPKSLSIQNIRTYFDEDVIFFMMWFCGTRALPMLMWLLSHNHILYNEFVILNAPKRVMTLLRSFSYFIICDPIEKYCWSAWMPQYFSDTSSSVAHLRGTMQKWTGMYCLSWCTVEVFLVAYRRCLHHPHIFFPAKRMVRLVVHWGICTIYISFLCNDFPSMALCIYSNNAFLRMVVFGQFLIINAVLLKLTLK